MRVNELLSIHTQHQNQGTVSQRVAPPLSRQAGTLRSYRLFVAYPAMPDCAVHAKGFSGRYPR